MVGWAALMRTARGHNPRTLAKLCEKDYWSSVTKQRLWRGKPVAKCAGRRVQVHSRLEAIMSLLTITAILAAAGNPGASTASFPLSAGTKAVVWQAELAPAHYAMSALLAAYQPRDPLYPDALDMTGIDSVKHLSAIVAAMNDDARAALLQATLNALNERLKQATGETRKWLEKKKKIVEGAIAKLGR